MSRHRLRSRPVASGWHRSNQASTTTVRGSVLLTVSGHASRSSRFQSPGRPRTGSTSTSGCGAWRRHRRTVARVKAESERLVQTRGSVKAEVDGHHIVTAAPEEMSSVSPGPEGLSPRCLVYRPRPQTLPCLGLVATRSNPSSPTRTRRSGRSSGRFTGGRRRGARGWRSACRRRTRSHRPTTGPPTAPEGAPQARCGERLAIWQTSDCRAAGEDGPTSGRGA
jgi:hypothetical protein